MRRAVSTKSIPSDIQEAFQASIPGESVIYVGDSNRGLEMNAVLRSNPLRFAKYPDEKYAFDGFGAVFYGRNRPSYVVGELVGGGADADSNNFYLVLKNPIDGQMMVFQSVNQQGENNRTRLGVWDLSKKINQTWAGGLKYHLFWQMDRGFELGEFMQPGDFVFVWIQWYREGERDLDSSTWKNADGFYELLNILSVRFGEREYGAQYAKLKGS